jgi:hypothetical protein
VRDKDAGSAHIDEIWARPRTTARAVQRGPAAQYFVLKRVLKGPPLEWRKLFKRFPKLHRPILNAVFPAPGGGLTPSCYQDPGAPTRLRR